MSTKEAILLLEHICYDDFNLLDHQIKGRLEAIEVILKENQSLKKQLEELESIVGLRQKRNLINKFNKEYDEEDKKKNPNRSHAEIIPDAEEVYKRYYEMKNQQKEFIEWLEQNIENEEYCYLAQNPGERCRKDIFEEALSKYKEIIGEEKW